MERRRKNKCIFCIFLYVWKFNYVLNLCWRNQTCFQYHRISNYDGVRFVRMLNFRSFSLWIYVFFSFFFSTWLCSLLFSAVCVYSATLSLVERRALLTCDTISKYRNVSKQWCWWVWSSHSLCVFLAKLLLTARTWEGDAWLSRTELMECVRTDVALRVCAWLWVSAFVCAFMCVGIENVKQPVQNGATSSAFAGWPIQQIK